MKNMFYILLIFSVSFSVFGMDFSNNEMSFDSEEVEKSLTEQPEARELLDRGRELYKKKKYKSAANKFFKVISNEDFKASYDEANFNLGKCARKLVLPHLSLQ